MQRGKDRETLIPQRALRVEIRFLGQVADADAARAVEAAGGGFILADEDAQQGGLADAVRPDDGQPLALGDAEGQPAEDVAVPEGFGEVGDGDEGHKNLK